MKSFCCGDSERYFVIDFTIESDFYLCHAFLFFGRQPILPLLPLVEEFVAWRGESKQSSARALGFVIVGR